MIELTRVTGCREYLGEYVWCKHDKSRGDFCEKHATDRAEWLQRMARK